MIGLLLAAAIAADTPGWATFSAEPAFRLRTTVTIGNMPAAKGAPPVYWFRREIDNEIRWTDSARCPAALDAIRAMPDIAIRPAIPSQDEISVTADGTLYALETGAMLGSSNGRLKISSNVGSSLAAWTDAALAALAHCWKAEPPIS